MSHRPVVGSQTIDLPAGRFHYLSWGAERTDLPSMLLLHGITSSALSWVRVGPALATRYRVYALDIEGTVRVSNRQREPIACGIRPMMLPRS